MSVTYLFCNSRYSDVTQYYSFTRHFIFCASQCVYVDVDGKVIKMEQINETDSFGPAILLAQLPEAAELKKTQKNIDRA